MFGRRNSQTPVGPWPERPRSAAREPGCTGPGPEHAFPSARAAILACLRLAGIGPNSVVATPECVTGCLVDAVRRCARPVRGGYATNPGAAIVYEQWGWPLPAEAEDAVRTRLAGVPTVVDRVDSADFLGTPRTYGTFEVVSLSKVLGTDAGGLARHRPGGGYVRFAPAASARPCPGTDHPGLISHPAVRELFKQSQYVHPALVVWLADNCAVTALEAERRSRSRAARLVLDSPLSAGWPAWMQQAIESGAGPVWAPVLRGCEPHVQWQAIARLADDWGIRAALRMFNWTGNPLSACYEPSVALPIHGGVDGLASVVSGLVRQTSGSTYVDNLRPRA